MFGVKSAKKVNLKTHIVSDHEGKRPFKCEVCSVKSNLKHILHLLMKERNHVNVRFVVSNY